MDIAQQELVAQSPSKIEQQSWNLHGRTRMDTQVES
jgi:hypothetical protein